MIFVNFATYSLVTIVFVLGFKFAGFKNSYHDDFMSMSSTKSLRGLAAMLILFHHISQEQPFIDATQIQIFRRLGPALVAIFFFCSGYGLIKNFDSKPDYLHGFLKKRIEFGLLIPFYVNVLLYGIYYLIVGAKFEPLQWVTKIMGLTLMNGFAWFPIVLILLYLAFYFIFKYVKNQRTCFILMLLMILGQGIFFCHLGHFAWWAGPKENWWMETNAFENAAWWMRERVLWFCGEWWVNATIGFFVGMFFARKEEPILNWFKKNYWLKLVLSIFVFVIFQAITALCQSRFGYWGEYAGHGPQIGCKIISYLSQLPQMCSFLVMLYAIRMKIKISNPITRFFGKYSLHTYLMNLIPLSLFHFLIYKNGKPYFELFNYNLAIYIAAVLVCSVLLAIFEERICRGIICLLSRRSVKNGEIKDENR